MTDDSGAGTAVRDLQALFEAGPTGALTDGQLLDRFVSRREEAAFEAIIERHGPMVWGVCRRVVRDHHDAEDAFQATFCVLARKAAWVEPREKLGHWLYGVAYRTAIKARAAATKRRTREQPVPDMPEPEQVQEDQTADLLSLLDFELSRLPEKYRIPIVLCELEGQSHRQAAVRLGWPIGTVSGRLSRARELLARRLSRRGVAFSAGSLATVLAQDTASASIPPRLVRSTAHAASLIAVGHAMTAGVVSSSVAALTREMLKAMLHSKIKLGGMVLLVALIAGTGSAWLLSRAVTAAQEPGESKPAAPSPDSTQNLADQLQGVWTGVVAEVSGQRAVPAENVPLPEAKIRVRGNELTLRGLAYGNILAYSPTMEQKFNLKISKNANTSTIDLTLPAAPDDLAPSTYLGIYRLEGDELTICLNIPNKKRPAEFKTTERSMQLLLKLRRDKTAKWEETPAPLLLKPEPGEERG